MKNYCYTLFTLMLLAFSGEAQAQKRSDPVVDFKAVADSTWKNDERIFYFPFINEYRYYNDPEELKVISKDLKKGDTLDAYRRLYEYVMRFGSRNFQKDHYLIWKLGRLAEDLGYVNKAKALYRLVLKHHPQGNFKQYRLYYDSLTRKDRTYYLPVEYYYTYANISSDVDTLDIPESVYTDLGDSVNSVYNDYAPGLSGNDLILIYSSQRNRKQEGMRYVSNEDLFYSRKADSLYITQTEAGSRIDTLPWTESKPFRGLNTRFNEGSACISRDGKTIYFARCDSPDGYGDCDLYVSHQKEDGSWEEGANLGIQVNSLAWDSHPALSHTEDTLFFASDRLGGFGLSDIYYTYRYRSSINRGDTSYSWAPARNLGPIINTRYNEVSPFYHPVFAVLYFSSNSQLVSFGGFDIYRSYKYRGRWTNPINIGPLVNYRNDEYYFTIDSQAQNLYYAKTKRVNVFDYLKGDSIRKPVLNLHTAFLPMEAQPRATTTFKGVVRDSITGEALEGIISIIDLDDGTEIAPRKTNEEGAFQFDLIRDKNYLVIITGEDFFRVEREFLLKGDTSITVSTPSIKFKKWKFESIKFEHNSSEVTPDMYTALNKLVIFLSDHPNLGLKISGHTDSQGDSQSNLVLSQARADAIKNYIVAEGKFKPSRVVAKGFGDSQPIVEEEDSEEAHRINRRVEFEIFKLP